MARSPGGTTPGARSVHRALLLLVAALVLAAAVIFSQAVAVPGAVAWQPALFHLCAAVYLGAGVLACWRRPSNPLGTIMVVGCLALLVGTLVFTPAPVLVAVSQVFATMILSVMVHLLHAFPSGHLRSPVSRWTVLTGYAVSLLLQVPQVLFAPRPPPHHLLGIADRPGLAAAAVAIQAMVGSVVMVLTMVVLLRRLRAADDTRRRVLAPLYAFGMVAVVFIPLSANVLPALLELPSELIGVSQLAVITGVPLAFCLALLRGGFARTGEVEELGAWLGGTGTARTTLTEALAGTLGDPSLTVAFWDSSHGRYVDAAGGAVELPPWGGDGDASEAWDGRASVGVDLEGRRVGAIVYDAVLIADPEPVRAAGSVVALAVDRERLTAQLHAGQQALRQSRQRLVAASDRERARIAQNLHDGLQSILVVLALDAQRIASRPGATAETVDAATRLRTDVDAVADELRRFVYQLMPAPLLERGLPAAAQDLVDHLPVPTALEVSIADGEVPPAVERTAYFVLAEALTNAVKHAEAGRLGVRLDATDGTLVVEVTDDGVGGARTTGGLGLSGLADRVDVLGGQLQVDSPPGGGTRLRAELPCGS